MRCLTLGLLVALVLTLAPSAAADRGLPIGTVPGIGFLDELVSYVLSWFGSSEQEDPEPPSKMGPGVEPNGGKNRIGPGVEPNGVESLPQPQDTRIGPGLEPGG